MFEHSEFQFTSLVYSYSVDRAAPSKTYLGFGAISSAAQALKILTCPVASRRESTGRTLAVGTGEVIDQS